MKKTFGLGCHLIHINTPFGDQTATKIGPDLWSTTLAEVLPMYAAKAGIDPHQQQSYSPRSSITSMNLNLVESSETSREYDGSAANTDSATSRAPKPQSESLSTNLAEKSSYSGLLSDVEVKIIETFVKEFLVQAILPNSMMILRFCGHLQYNSNCLSLSFKIS